MKPLPVFVPERHKYYIPPAECPEQPWRLERIVQEFCSQGIADIRAVHAAEISELTKLHAPELLAWLKNITPTIPEGKWVTPDLDRQMAKISHDSSVYAFRTSWQTIISSANLVVEAVKTVLTSRNRFALALCRPPGHHAARNTIGGFCYLNNAALAAVLLLETGRPAILDLDFHHGNGTQDIFYTQADVLTVSLHGDPARHYPYDAGYTDETGSGAGLGANRNVILSDMIFGDQYLLALEDELERIAAWKPDYLVVPMGFDTYHRDPLGAFSLDIPDYQRIGARVAQLGLPTIVTLEGGYHEEIGQCAAAFARGLLSWEQ